MPTLFSEMGTAALTNFPASSPMVYPQSRVAAQFQPFRAGAVSINNSLAPAPPPANRQVIGRVLAVSGAQVSVGLSQAPAGADVMRATVGKFLGILSGSSVIVGMITEIAERPVRDQEPHCRSTARIDLVGEIKASSSGAARFQRGITEYPLIGEAATMMNERELRLIYGGADDKFGHIGALQQDATIPARIDIEQLVSKHFAILGTTGVGKSSGVAIILQ